MRSHSIQEWLFFLARAGPAARWVRSQLGSRPAKFEAHFGGGGTGTTSMMILDLFWLGFRLDGAHTVHATDVIHAAHAILTTYSIQTAHATQKSKKSDETPRDTKKAETEASAFQ